MKVDLTDIQKWFIKNAINMKEAVLPLDNETMTEKEFKNDYGITKKQVKISLQNLYKKLQ